MRNSYKTIIALSLTLVAVLALGTGFAMAQSGDEADTAAPEAWAPGDGPGGIGGPAGSGGRGGFGGKRELMLGGEVVSVNGDIITLTTLRDEERSVKVTDQTSYKSKDGDVTLADVVPGEHIGVKLVAAPEEGQDAIAETVFIGAPDHQRHRPTVGEVTAVEGNSVTITTEDGEKQFTLPSIEVGQRLGVAADEDGNVKGLMYDPPERPQGAPAEAPAA